MTPTDSSQPSFQINPLSTVMAAEVTGLNLGSASQQDMEQLHRAFLDYHLVVVRNQSITDDDIERFARYFGPLEINQVRNNEDGGVLPPVHTIANVDSEGKPSNSPLLRSNYQWHSDKAYLPEPSLMTMLYGLEIPPVGGDTQFANMESAYEALPENIKQRLEGRQVVQSFGHMLDTLGQHNIIDAELVPPPITHPIVRTHPDTGRKSLFVGMYSCGIPGMDQAEAETLIASLLDHATQDRFTFTQKWQPKDFVFWDNRSLLHRAISNYEMGSHRRILRRCVVRGRAPQ